jgi:hypothetical protein
MKTTRQLITELSKKVEDINLAKVKAPKIRESFGKTNEGLFAIWDFAKKNQDAKLETMIKKTLDSNMKEISKHMNETYEW